ncbi:hypothetical protein E2C01_097262 [Portunus trituberculatus]|uniref:Uncharacterized protein n=1 Tax=Portunus trituberculatus TaxID=210409 RepID=A0A5B7JUQ5_PORTR|nr:hypothetical protein [Portunus trituberculatus]
MLVVVVTVVVLNDDKSSGTDGGDGVLVGDGGVNGGSRNAVPHKKYTSIQPHLTFTVFASELPAT